MSASTSVPAGGEPVVFLNGAVAVHRGDMREVVASLPAESIDSIVTDPPYHFASILKRYGKTDINGSGTNEVRARAASDQFIRASRGFMGKEWDGGDIAFDLSTWAAVLRVLKPGGHMVAFAAPKNAHRLTCAIEDAGFEIRDVIMWLFGTGFPKSHDAGKGRGTALKPAYEPIILARKALDGTVAANVAKWGTGAINIDDCRVLGEPVHTFDRIAGDRPRDQYRTGTGENRRMVDRGRWPANIITDGSEDVLAAFPETVSGDGGGGPKRRGLRGNLAPLTVPFTRRGDSGSAARFFYSAKASKADRAGSKHPTVKPIALMRYLCRLVTPPGGLILDPFAGTGTTGEAAHLEGFRAILIEREAEYQDDIARRLAGMHGALFARFTQSPSKEGP